MTRLLATVLLDIRRQFKEGFYLAAVTVAVLISFALRWVPHVAWDRLCPPLVLCNLVMTAFYFTAAIVLLEKNERTLEAQVVTPLRPREYLLAKVLSLSVLCLFESALLVVIASGIRLAWVPFVLGTTLLTTLYVLYGFFVVSRYHSFTDFLLPSGAWTALFALPILGWFGLINPLWLLWHPLQPPLWLLSAAWSPLLPWQWVYVVVFGITCVSFSLRLATRRFHRFVINRRGT